MTIRLFPAFFDHPLKIRFSEQEEDEVVELFLRAHAITNVPWILIALLAIVLPAALIWADQTFRTNLFASIPTQLLTGGIIIWYMLVLAYVFEKFLFWYFNIYIVTNIHVEDISLTSLLSRDITEIEIKDIESASSQIRGVFGSLFNYGTVTIETAAKAQSIIFKDVPKPDFVADRIQDLQEVVGGGTE